MFCELNHTSLIAVSGADAVSFLQAQLTSDIAGMQSPQTQYSGYCSPKGRLLATFLVWRDEDTLFLQLPHELRDASQSRLSKYVLRARVKLADATADFRLFGISGPEARRALAPISESLPEKPHAVVSAPGVRITCVPGKRYLVLADSNHGETIHSTLSASAREHTENDWARSEIEAGIPVITAATQEEYVPQMVNLDLIGAVSYSKGCYPGQEIVARMHYLGRLKQRMYRVQVCSDSVAMPGDAIYSREFGADQASGAIINAVQIAGAGFEALAVIQTASAAGGSAHWKSLDGPALAFLPLPYEIPS